MNSKSGPEVRRSHIKALTGQGSKRPTWKNQLHEALREEFIRFIGVGVKVNIDFLRVAPITRVYGGFCNVSAAKIEIQSGKPVAETITPGSVDDFCDRYILITRKRKETSI